MAASADEQTPPAQAGITHSVADEQIMPQAPQLFTSVLVWTQSPLQQAPLTHWSLAVHAAPSPFWGWHAPGPTPSQ